MACRVKPYFFPEVWITMGGFRLLGLSERSRLGEESRDDGLEDRERGEMGLGWRQPEESSEKKNTGTFPSVSHSFSHTFCPLLDLIKFCTCSDDERQC